ncbi:MAG: dephospho-CoA kinase [Thermodesulfobacteriota bacterium]
MNNQNINQTGAGGPAKLAVTGGVGSGKSVVCERFKSRGLRFYSADDLSRQAVEPGTEAHRKIVAHFGRQVLLPDGTLNRPLLRAYITEDEAAKAAMEGFVHPEVTRLMLEKFEAAAGAAEPIVGVEVPLLFEAGLQAFFDFVITVTVQKQRRIERIMARDHVSEAEAEGLMNIQMPEEKKCALSDFVIDNNGTLAQVHAAVDRVYRQLMERVKKKTEND